jgi:hypothetical protein
MANAWGGSVVVLMGNRGQCVKLCLEVVRTSLIAATKKRIIGAHRFSMPPRRSRPAKAGRTHDHASRARFSRALLDVYFTDQTDLLFGVGERAMSILMQRFTPGRGPAPTRHRPARGDWPRLRGVFSGIAGVSPCTGALCAARADGGEVGQPCRGMRPLVRRPWPTQRPVRRHARSPRFVRRFVPLLGSCRAAAADARGR